MAQIRVASGTRQLTAEDLALSLQGQWSLRCPLYNADHREWQVITFGPDSMRLAGEVAP